MAKTRDEIKDELVLDLAKSVLKASISTRENIARSLSTVSAIAIPAYVGALKIFSESVASVALLLKSMAVIFWTIALIQCVFILFPKDINFDFKNPEGIIEIHNKIAGKARGKAILAVGFQIIGFVAAALVFVN